MSCTSQEIQFLNSGICVSPGELLCVRRCWEPNTHPAAHPLLLRGQWEENRMRKLVGWDKVRETAYQLLFWVKWPWLGENEFNVLPMKTDSGSGKQRRAIEQNSIFSLPLPGSASLLSDPATHPTSSTVRHRDGHSQSIADRLSLSFHLIPSLCSSWVLPWATVL